MSRFLMLSVVLLTVAGAGATGAYMMSEGIGWQGGHHGMMGGSPGEMPCDEGPGAGECPYEDQQECEEHQQECEEASYSCPYHDDVYSRQGSGGCC